MSNPLTRWLARRLMAGLVKRTVISRPADYIIGGADNPYMYRWWIIPRNRWFNVYLHHVVKDDDDRALHDHPWPSLSLCLDGRLGEVYAPSPKAPYVEAVRFLGAGALVWRGARFAHRLFLPPQSPEAWTLFVTGPVVREWGFWCPKQSPAGGWRHWKEFTAYGEGGEKGRIGRGCE